MAKRSSVFTALSLLAATVVSAQEVLFTDEFETDASLENYDIVEFMNPEDIDDLQHFWEIGGYGFPEAPNSSGTSSTGLAVFVNTALGTADAVNFYTKEIYSGNIRASIDVWQSFEPGSTGTTETCTFGIMHSGDHLITWEGHMYAPGGNDLPASSDGYFMSMLTDSGAGSRGDYFFTEGFPDGAPGSSGSSDPQIYLCGDWEVADPANVNNCRVYLSDDSDDNDAFWATLFPREEGDPSKFLGSPGNRWVTITMEYIDGTITLYYNGTQVMQYVDEDRTYTSGKVMFGYEDAFSSLAGGTQFGTFDNFVIEQLETNINTWEIH